jgi:hypothetical protein
MPTSVTARNVLRRYTCAGAGLEDDLTASDKTHTLDFLPAARRIPMNRTGVAACAVGCDPRPHNRRCCAAGVLADAGARRADTPRPGSWRPCVTPVRHR